MPTTQYNRLDMIAIVERFSMETIDVSNRFEIFLLSLKTAELIKAFGVLADFFGVSPADLAYAFVALVDQFSRIAWPCPDLIFFKA
jgi:hypothetical protein